MEAERAAEPNNSSICFALEGIDSVGRPDQTCLVRVDGLHNAVNSLWLQRRAGPVRSYFLLSLLFLCHHCDWNFSTEIWTETVQNDRFRRVGLGMHHEVLSWFIPT